MSNYYPAGQGANFPNPLQTILKDHINTNWNATSLAGDTLLAKAKVDFGTKGDKLQRNYQVSVEPFEPMMVPATLGGGAGARDEWKQQLRIVVIAKGMDGEKKKFLMEEEIKRIMSNKGGLSASGVSDMRILYGPKELTMLEVNATEFKSVFTVQLWYQMVRQ